MKNLLITSFLILLLFGCVKKSEINKEVNLNIAFEASKTNVLEEDSVSFKNESTSSATNIIFKWVFDGADPSVSYDDNPKVKYLTKGMFDVKLIATINGKRDSLVSKNLIIVGERYVKANFKASTSSVFEDETVKFTNISSSTEADTVIKYKWLFEGGTPNQSTEKEPTVKYLHAGNFNAKLLVYSKNLRDSIETSTPINVKSSTLKGLMVYYPFYGNANDESGNSINGIVGYRATLTSGKSNQPRTAYQFIGESQSVIQIPTDKLKLDNYTYCLWLYLDKLPIKGYEFMPFAIGNVGGDQHVQALNSTNDGDGWAVGAYNLGYPSFFKASNVPLEEKKWYFIAMVRIDNSLKLYVNCQLVGEVSASDKVIPFYSSKQVVATLGCRFDGTYPFTGKIDEFRIYNRALTEEDISKLCALDSQVTN